MFYRHVLLSAFVALALVSAVPCAAQAPVFFSVLNDVPAMKGLYEVPEGHLVFDKAEGRIATLYILMEGVDAEQVKNYYAQALPQFGWKAQANDSFLRGGERLSFEFQNKRMLTISVSPL